MVAIDYCMKWAEARATRKAIDTHCTTKFLYEQVISRFGHPLEIFNDHSTHFINGFDYYFASKIPCHTPQIHTLLLES